MNKIKFQPNSNSYFEVSFFKERDKYKHAIGKMRGKVIVESEDACTWMKFTNEEDKQGEMFFFQCDDGVLVFNIVGLVTDYCIWMMNEPFRKKFADKTEIERQIILSTNIPAFAEYVFEQVVDARNKEFFIPQ